MMHVMGSLRWQGPFLRLAPAPLSLMSLVPSGVCGHGEISVWSEQKHSHISFCQRLMPSCSYTKRPKGSQLENDGARNDLLATSVCSSSRRFMFKLIIGWHPLSFYNPFSRLNPKLVSNTTRTPNCPPIPETKVACACLCACIIISSAWFFFWSSVCVCVQRHPTARA